VGIDPYARKHPLQRVGRLPQIGSWKYAITLVFNPTFKAKTVTSPVETMQVAPTILKALGLDPNALQAVKIEGTQVLPDFSLSIDDPNN
jgi:hypothetical protein